MPNPHLKSIFPTGVTNLDSQLIWAKPDKSTEIKKNKDSQINYPNPSYNVWTNNYKWYEPNPVPNNNYFGKSGTIPYISDYVGESYGVPNKPQTSPFKNQLTPTKKQWIYGW